MSGIEKVAFLLDKIGTLPISVLLFVMIAGPWVVMLWISRSNERRFEAVREMYEKNVELVKDYASLAKNLQNVVIANIEIMTGMKDKIETNQFCPAVRRESGK